MNETALFSCPSLHEKDSFDNLILQNVYIHHKKANAVSNGLHRLLKMV